MQWEKPTADEGVTWIPHYTHTTYLSMHRQPALRGGVMEHNYLDLIEILNIQSMGDGILVSMEMYSCRGCMLKPTLRRS